MMIQDNKCLMITIMKAASDLIQTYGSGLSDGDIRDRMVRISGDLLYGAEECRSYEE
jgi:hypothetical protein